MHVTWRVRPAARDLLPTTIKAPSTTWTCGERAELGMLPVQGPEARKKRLRAEQLRWHPDKFQARFGSRLVEADKAEVLQRVSALSISLTEAVKQQ